MKIILWLNLLNFIAKVDSGKTFNIFQLLKNAEF